MFVESTVVHDSRPGSTRRTYVRLTGLAALTTRLAGCASNGGGYGAETLRGEDYPAVDEWLTETGVGVAAPNYDGSMLDRRDQDTVAVEVGAGDNGTVFDPAAAVSAGATTRWEWTGQGGAHNAEAEPEEQIEKSDYEFPSGDPQSGSDVTFEQTVDRAGVALYHCHPHLSVGMKGAVVE